MPAQALFGLSIVFSFIAWGVVTALFIWPELKTRSRVEALKPLLVLHSFRFVGLSFLIPGVVLHNLPAAFARDAAYGDVIALILALAALAALRTRASIALVWVFNIWGTLDLLNAFYQAVVAGLPIDQLGATYFIPTAIVPLLLITHGVMFRILMQHDAAPAEVAAGRAARAT